MAIPGATGPTGPTNYIGWTPAQWAEFERTQPPEVVAAYKKIVGYGDYSSPALNQPLQQIPERGSVAWLDYVAQKGRDQQIEAQQKREQEYQDKIGMEAAEKTDDFWRKHPMPVQLPEDRTYYVPGVPLVAIPRGTTVSSEALHPMELYAMGVREQPSKFEISLWEKRHRGVRYENSGISGVLSGVGKMADFVGNASEAAAGGLQKVADVAGQEKSAAVNLFRGLATGARAVSQATAEGAEAKQAMGIHGLGGDIVRGVNEMVAMLPMFRMLGPFALPIYEGLKSWAESNADTEVEVPGFGKVKGRTLPTLIGAAQGAILQGLLKAAEMKPGIAGRITGGAVFSLPEVFQAVLTGQKIDPKNVAAAFTQGLAMTHGIPGMGKALSVAAAGPEAGGWPTRMGTGDVEAKAAQKALGLDEFSEFNKELTSDRAELPGTLEWSQKYGTTRNALEQTVLNVEKKISDVDPRVPAKGSQSGRREEPVRYDEEGNPIPSGSRYAFAGTGLKELGWLREKRGTVAFEKKNAGTKESIDTFQKAIEEVNGGPLPYEGSILRTNADLYRFAVDPDKMCPRSQKQRNTQAIIEANIGRKLTADEVADIREFMKQAGDIVACPQCYTESHRIQGYSAAALSPLGNYKFGDLQRKLLSPSGKADRAWMDMHTGLRSFANTDYKPQFLPGLMKIYTDAAQLGLHGNTYTKQFDYVDIFAPTKIKINISLGADVVGGKLVENLDIGVPWDATRARRDKFQNVGTVLVAKTNNEIGLALDDPFIDHVLGMHHSGIPVRIRDRWGALNDYTSVQSDTWKQGISDAQKKAGRKVYEDICKSHGIEPEYKGKDEVPTITDWMHSGDKEVFLDICEKIGLKPRFSGGGKPGDPNYTPDWTQHPNYMKLVGPECGKFGDNTKESIVPNFDLKAANKSINDWAERGGMDLESGYSTEAAKTFSKQFGKPSMFGKGSEIKGPAKGHFLFSGIRGKDIEAIRKLIGDEIPLTGTHPAIRLKDGRLLVDKNGMYPTHVAFAMSRGIKPSEVDSGGWVSDGVYEGSDRSDIGRWREQRSAVEEVERKRAERLKAEGLQPNRQVAELPADEVMRLLHDKTIGTGQEFQIPGGTTTLHSGTGGKDLETVAKALGLDMNNLTDTDRILLKAAGVKVPQTPEEVAQVREVNKARKFFEGFAKEQAEREAIPKPTGETLRGPEKVTVQPIGTLKDLEADGIVYKSDVGKGEQTLRDYDKYKQTLIDAGRVEELDPLPGRPEGFEEAAPTPEQIRTISQLADKGQQFIETGLRFFERAGGGGRNILKDTFFTPMKRGLAAVERQLGALGEKFGEVLGGEGMKIGNYKDSVAIGRILTARQFGGPKVLEMSGFHTGDPAAARSLTPTPRQARVIKFIDDTLLKAFHEINAARLRAGRPEIEWRQDYFTFWHLAEAANKRGINLLTAPKEAIQEAFDSILERDVASLTKAESAKRKKMSFSKFMFLERSGKLGPIDLDAFGVFGRYMHSAYEQIYLSEAQSVMDKIVNGKWEIDGKPYSMANSQPDLHGSLRDYMGFIAGGAVPGDLDRPVYAVLNKLGRNVAIGKIGFNVKSMLNQLSSNVHTWSELGTKYWGKGFADYSRALEEGIKTGGKGEKYRYAKDVGDLATRRREIAFEEWMKKRPTTAFGRGWQTVGEWSMAPLQMLDMATAEITWRGAYAKAMDGVVRGIEAGDHEAALDYASETVARTQGSTSKADITRLQRSQSGRIASVLQNFVINEWGFITRDVMGIGNVERSRENIAKVSRFVIGAVLMDILYEDVLKIKSPFNVIGNPMQMLRPMLKAAKKKDANAYKVGVEGLLAAGETIPILGRGFSAYGGNTGLGAGLETFMQTGKFFRKPGVSTGVDYFGSMLGIPGSFEAARAMKSLQKGASPVQAIVGATLAGGDKKKAMDMEYDYKTKTFKQKKTGKYNYLTRQFE